MNTKLIVHQSVVPVCTLRDGGYFYAEALFKRVLIHMRIGTGYDFKLDYPISLVLSDEVSDEGELVYTDGFMSTFTLSRQDMMVACGWMIQKLFPNMSWQRSWKRRDGRHAHWLTTEELARFVGFNKAYSAIWWMLWLEKPVDTELLNEFAFFRNWVSAHHGMVPPVSVISDWKKATFAVMALALELEYNTARTTFSFEIK